MCICERSHERMVIHVDFFFFLLNASFSDVSPSNNVTGGIESPLSIN